MAAEGDDRAGLAPREHARCGDGEHRCAALMLGFFALLRDGVVDEMTRAAVLACERRS